MASTESEKTTEKAPETTSGEKIATVEKSEKNEKSSLGKHERDEAEAQREVPAPKKTKIDEKPAEIPSRGKSTTAPSFLFGTRPAASKPLGACVALLAFVRSHAI